MRIWVVLPAYNEAENIPAIFQGLRQLIADTYNLDLRVILVDDCSTDNTLEVTEASSQGVQTEILKNEKNGGLSYTFMRGTMRAAECADDNDMIICMDADNTHLPGQIRHLTRSIQEGRDVVIASRFRPGSVVRGVPFHRKFLTFGLLITAKILFPIQGVRDYSCGYRAYRASLLKKAIAEQGQDLFASGGFACMVGILLKLSKLDAIFGEIPIVLRYDQKGGKSKMDILDSIINTFKIFLRERFG